MTDISKVISFNATTATEKALDELGLLTGDTWTESINKAVQSYAVIQAANELLIQDTPASEFVSVRFK